MNRAFEKILEKLRSLTENYERLQSGFVDSEEIMKYVGMEQAIDSAMEIVQEVAEEYKDGWIACSDMMPDDFISMAYLTTVKGHFYPEISYYCVANHKWFSNEKSTKEVDVIAWQPLPECFKECE